MATKVMKLKRDDTCASCGVELPAGTRAEWDSQARHTTCLECVATREGGTTQQPDLEGPAPVEVGAPVDPVDELTPRPIDTGVAGASARREHQRREGKRIAKIEDRWGTGFKGKTVKAFSAEPQSTRAWAQGARGEERLAKILSKRLGDRAVLLHDRRVPRTRGNIDHLAVASSGIWVIDAKQYKGRVERRDVGKFFTADVRLYVGGRDQSRLVQGMRWQHDAVVAALEDFDGTNVPVHLALTFVDAEWSLLRRPIKFGDVTVVWPNKLADLIAAPGPVPPELVADLARIVAEKLPVQG